MSKHSHTILTVYCRVLDERKWQASRFFQINPKRNKESVQRHCTYFIHITLPWKRNRLLNGTPLLVTNNTRQDMHIYFRGFPQSPGKCLDIISIKLRPLPSESFPIHLSSYHWTLYSIATDVVKTYKNQCKDITRIFSYTVYQCCPTFLYIGAHLTDG
jgi:hypothetical protein